MATKVVLDGYSLIDQDPLKIKSLSNDAWEIIGVTNYLGHSSKVGTLGQLEAWWDAGFMIAQNFEISGTEWHQGYNRGVQDGNDARQQMNNYGLGPDEMCIQSTDTSVAPSELAILERYQTGFNMGFSGGRPQGAYGPGFALAHLASLGLIFLCWQWKDGRVPSIPQANMRQTYLQPWPVSAVGCPYDLNIVLKTNWGQHPLVPNDPPLPPPVKDEEMFTLVRHNGGPVYRIPANESQKTIVTDLRAIACDFDTLRLAGVGDPHIVDLIDGPNQDWGAWLNSIPTVNP